MLKVKMKKLYPQMMNNGIMTDLNDFSVPWKTYATASNLDFGYYHNSANKLASPILLDLAEIESYSDVSALTVTQRTQIAGSIYTIFNRKWNRLWDAYMKEYDVTNNYFMDEETTRNLESTRAGTNTGTVNTADTGTIADTGSEGGTRTVVLDKDVTNGGTVETATETTNTGTVGNSKSDTGTVTNVLDKDTTNTGTQANAGSSDTLDGIFGFNSSTSVGSETSENTNSNTRTDNLASTEDTTDTETRNLTETSTRTDNLASTEETTRTDNLETTEDSTETETRNLTSGNTRTLNTTNLETQNLAHAETVGDEETITSSKTGNTGIYTPQMMLTSEIEFWAWNFFKEVFYDIDSILCLSVY